MYDNVFERVEQKYIISKDKRDLLLKKINKFIKKDKYHKVTICNIYFDNTNNDLIINSIEKPIFKDKIRIRSYNIPTLEDYIFFEIKRKYKGVVGKRRIKLKLSEFYSYINTGFCDNNSHIMKEINYYIKYYNLEPQIYIAYDRKSYVSRDDKNFRITIDSNLRSRRENLKLEFGDMGNNYFNEDMYILEIKSLGSIPLWFSDILSELKIYPTSFSKYGSIYKKERNDKYAY